MNKADNESGSKSIDSLINYETVKVFLLYVLYIVIVFTLVSNSNCNYIDPLRMCHSKTCFVFSKNEKNKNLKKYNFFSKPVTGCIY